MPRDEVMAERVPVGPWRVRTMLTREMYFVRESDGVLVASVQPDGRGGWRWEVPGGVAGEVATAVLAKEAADGVLREMGYVLAER